MKHETFSRLFGNFEQEENPTNLNSGQADDYLYLTWKHNQSPGEDNIDFDFKVLMDKVFGFPWNARETVL